MLPTVQWDENETYVYNQTFSNYPWDITDHKCTPHLKSNLKIFKNCTVMHGHKQQFKNVFINQFLISSWCVGFTN